MFFRELYNSYYSFLLLLIYILRQRKRRAYWRRNSNGNSIESETQSRDKFFSFFFFSQLLCSIARVAFCAQRRGNGLLLPLRHATREERARRGDFIEIEMTSEGNYTAYESYPKRKGFVAEGRERRRRHLPALL